MPQIIEDQQRVGEEKDGVGQAEIVAGAAGEPFHVVHHLVGEKSDGTALEPRQSRHGHRLEPAHEIAQRLERIAIRNALGVTVGVPQRDPTVFRGEDQSRLGSEEGVTRPRLSAFDRLEEERVRTRPEPQIGGERRVEVGGKLGKDGDEVAPARELPELVTGRRK